MKLRLSSRAHREFEAAADYYIERNPDAARRFGATLEHLFQELQRFPRSGPLTDMPPVRVRVVRGFPYIVLYEVIDDTIAVLSVFHTAQDPEKR